MMMFFRSTNMDHLSFCTHSVNVRNDHRKRWHNYVVVTDNEMFFGTVVWL